MLPGCILHHLKVQPFTVCLVKRIAAYSKYDIFAECTHLGYNTNLNFECTWYFVCDIMIFVGTYRFESNCRNSFKVISWSFESFQDIGFREKIQPSMFSHPEEQIGNHVVIKNFFITDLNNS